MSNLKFKYHKKKSLTAKSAGLDIICILESIPETERIDALAVAIKCYTYDSEAIRNLRKAAKELNE